MKLLRGTQPFKLFPQGVVASIGNFDGVHLGHQHLIQALKKKAEQLNLPVVLILFEPQPREYLQKEKAPARLSSLREKLRLLHMCKVDYVYCLRFDKRLAQTSAKEFIQRYLIQALNIKYLLVGGDFKFGQDREGNLTMLQEAGLQAEGYQDFCIGSEKISSTRIRLTLAQGNFELTAKLLGRNYSMWGRVIRGDGRGRMWGIPTANLTPNRLILPLHGVFVVQVKLGSQLIQGVANLGKRPTVDGSKNILEIHLLDFNQSIYGELLEVFFLYKLRDEVKFGSVEELISQIHEDIAGAREYLNSYV